MLLLACLAEYLILLIGNILLCLKCSSQGPKLILVFVNTSGPFLVLILTFVLLILGWLRIFDAGFATILVVSTRHPFDAYLDEIPITSHLFTFTN